MSEGGGVGGGGGGNSELTIRFPLCDPLSQSLWHMTAAFPSCTFISNITLGLRGLFISGSNGARQSTASILPG